MLKRFCAIAYSEVCELSPSFVFCCSNADHLHLVCSVTPSLLMGTEKKRRGFDFKIKIVAAIGWVGFS